MPKLKKHQPWLIVIAGPNGAGKSTFYDLVLKDDPMLKNAEFVNLDNAAKEMTQPGEDPNDYMLAAGKQIIEKISNKITNKESFIYETTASGRTHLKIMEEARRNHFKIATVFIGLSNVTLSHLRVKKRVAEGGHSVLSEDINRRYPKIIKNFPDMLAKSDVAAVFDNSKKDPYNLIFLMDDRAFRVFYKYPKWLSNSLKERKTRKEFIPMLDVQDLQKIAPEELTDILEKNLEGFIPYEEDNKIIWKEVAKKVISIDGNDVNKDEIKHSNTEAKTEVKSSNSHQRLLPQFFQLKKSNS